jgi:hypothetical protein
MGVDDDDEMYDELDEAVVDEVTEFDLVFRDGELFTELED